MALAPLLNVTNRGRRAITLPQVRGKSVKIPAKATRRFRVFAPNAGKVRHWRGVRLLRVTK